MLTSEELLQVAIESWPGCDLTPKITGFRSGAHSG